MASSDLTLWEGLVLMFVVGIAEKTEDNIVSRTDIQRVQPGIADFLKEHFDYKIGRTPESTVDKIIQDLEKKGFLEMLFRRGGERGSYKVNVLKSKEELQAALGTKIKR